LAQPEPHLAERASHLDGLIGHSAAMQRVLRKIDIYGPTAAPVVVTGETGTGKELTAHALHTHSPRRRHPFVAVNCAALSEELLETELFGHERGAFTSAVRSHRGRFERAHTGTLFLDEIGELPLRLQAKLLRVLEDDVIERVGGEREVSVDVRLISATNVPLEQAGQARTFRLDLYHRLEVLRIHMPPLRERSRVYPGTWDVNGRETAQATRPTIITPYPAAPQTPPLLSSPIHDMESVTDGVWRLSGQSDIASFSRQESINVTPYELAQPMTPECLAWAYQQAGGNITRAARLLGVHKATFYRHMKTLGLRRENLEPPGAMPLDQLATEERPAGEADE
jgi:transcriptional regulator with GAF, ATPase, and Fis domain